MSVKAILTCDIVNSTKLTPAKERKLLADIKFLFTDNKIEFFRGDSFQVCIDNPMEALKLCLLCRVAALKLFKEQKIPIIDVRVSIGIGEVKLPIKELSTAKGEAFLLSGRSFDIMAKSNLHLAITINNELANEGLNVIADYLNNIFHRITGKQAEVLFELLKNETQQTAAKKLKKTKSTIHQLATSAQWQQIEKLLLQYQTIIKLAS